MRLLLTEILGLYAMNKYLSIALPLMLLMTACTSAPHIDYETRHNFSGYQHFAFKTHAKEDAAIYDAFGGDIFEARLYRAITQSLTTKGFNKTQPANFYIDYALSTETRAQVSYQKPPGYFRFWHYNSHNYHDYYDSYRIDDIRQQTLGVLTLKVIDASTNKTVWTGRSKSLIRAEKSPEAAEAALQARITKLLANFPPHTVVTL